MELRSAGYRLVYRVDEDVVFVTVIAIRRRDRNQVYREAQARLGE
ncbi:MAG TPA: hypothetical protein PLN31_18510 [Azoarcus taiwanensis]|nr:hypothetical protein [Azoarcus taiwanensis]